MGAVVDTGGVLDASLFSGDVVERRAGSRDRLAMALDALLEGGWLAGVVVLPLIFSPNLTQVFGVPKAAFLWGLAMALSVVFLLKAAVVGAPARPAVAGPSSGGGRLAWRLPWAHGPAPAGAPLIGAALTFGAVATLATLGSVAQAVSWWGAYGSFSGLFTLFSVLAIFALVATHLRTPAQLQRLLLAIVWASVPFLRFGAAQKFQFSPLPWSADITPAQVFSPAGDQLATGAYLAMIIPLAVYLAVTARAIEFRLIYILLAVAELAVLAVGGFVGSWVGVACGFFALALLLGRAVGTATGRALGALAATLVVVVTLVGVVVYAKGQDASWKPGGWLGTAATNAQSRSASLDYRRQVWQGAWDLSMQRPVLGWGPDTFTSTFGRTAPTSLATMTDRGGQHPPQAYNLPLEILQGSGALGLLAWLATLVAFFGVAAALLRRGGSREGRAVTAGLVAAMVAYLVTVLTTSPGLPALLLSWVILGIAAALAGPLWDRLVLAETESAPVTGEAPAASALPGDEQAGPPPEGQASAETLPPDPNIEAMRGPAAPGAGMAVAAATATLPPRDAPPVLRGPIPTDPWRNLGALLAAAALVVYLAPLQPLGLFWEAVQHVRADAWNHDGTMADANSDYQKSAKAYRLAYGAAPFQAQYGLNAGKSVLQDLANRSPQPPRAQVQALLAESETDLRGAHRLNPWDAAISAQLARLFGVWASLTGQNRLPEARRIIDQTLSQHPNDAALAQDWAQTAQQLGRPDEAIRTYKLVADRNPTNAEAHLQAATSLNTMADTLLQGQQPNLPVARSAVDTGLQEARKAVTLGPKDPGAAWMLVAALSYKNAQVVVGTAKSQKDPRAVAAVRQMLDDHRKALTFRPGDVTTTENAIRAALFVGDQRTAYLLAKDAVRLHPDATSLATFIKSLPASVKK